MTQLQFHKATIRHWISSWTDQKLAEVYAFNRDGKMEYYHHCRCLLGVTLADRLHTRDCMLDATGAGPNHHYDQAKAMIGGAQVEIAYRRLGDSPYDRVSTGDSLRRRRLSAILRAEMRLRARRQAQPSAQPLAAQQVEMKELVLVS